VRILVSTFGPEDAERVLQAMRQLPYDKLVLIGQEGIQGCEAFQRIMNLEDMAGHAVDAETVDEDDFMALVDGVSEILLRHANGGRNPVTLNISGGSKLLGDAALLAAFRFGLEAFHFDGRITKLPILQGATAKDRFTASQTRLINVIGERNLVLDDLIVKMKPASKQSTERVIRELRKQNLLKPEVRRRKVRLSLSPSGLEVFRAIRLTATNKRPD
jgi:hypothetical protein